MIKEKNRLQDESRKSSKAGIDNTLFFRREHSNLDSFSRKRQTLESQKSLDLFPRLTCTTANVPKIMRRNLSSESEFYNWVTGLPKIGNRSIVALRPVTTDNLKTKTVNTNNVAEIYDQRRSKVGNIVYNVPMLTKAQRKKVKMNKVPTVHPKENISNKVALTSRLPMIKQDPSTSLNERRK